MDNVFSWEKICSSENAALLESLLDKKVVPYNELIELFFPNDAKKFDGYSFLLNLIRPWEWLESIWNTVIGNILAFKLLKLPLSCFNEAYFYLCFCSMVQHYYIPNFGEVNPQVYTDKILALMIREGLVPTEICRLPRLDKDIIGFSPIHDYYETILDYNTATTEEIVNHIINCVPDPIPLTYSEAIKRLEKNECPTSLIALYAKQGKHFVYIQAAQDSISNCCQAKQFAKQSIDYYRVPNCGNPSYMKRYRGLERLTQSTVEALFEGKVISIKTNTIQGLKVQATDIETKYHIERYIKSCIQVDKYGGNKLLNAFQVMATLHLEKDIDALIFDYHATKTSPPDSPSPDIEAQPIERVTTPPQGNSTYVTPKKASKQKRRRSKKHPLFQTYVKTHASAGSIGDYIKMMQDEQFIFNSKADYLTKANEDNCDNTQDCIKRVALVCGTSKFGKEKYDIYYKPVQNDGKSLGRAKSIPVRTAETYFT